MCREMTDIFIAAKIEYIAFCSYFRRLNFIIKRAHALAIYMYINARTREHSPIIINI